MKTKQRNTLRVSFSLPPILFHSCAFLLSFSFIQPRHAFPFLFYSASSCISLLSFPLHFIFLFSRRFSSSPACIQRRTSAKKENHTAQGLTSFFPKYVHSRAIHPGSGGQIEGQTFAQPLSNFQGHLFQRGMKFDRKTFYPRASPLSSTGRES